MENYKIVSNGGGVYYTEADTGEQFTLLQLVNKMIALCNKILNLIPIDTDNVADLSITTQKLADASVTYEKIANGAISDVKIASQGVTTDNIRDYNITNDKIANDTITGFKIAEKTISGYHIGDGAITDDKIANATITPDKLKTDGQEEWPLYNVNSTKITTDTIFPKNDKLYVNGPLVAQNDLEVDGNIEATTMTYDTWRSKDVANGTQVLQFRLNEGSYELYTYYTLNVQASLKGQSIYCSSIFPNTIFVDANGSIMIGSTRLDEATLKKLIALIPAS